MKRLIRIIQLLAALVMLVGTLNWLDPHWVQGVSQDIGGGAHTAGNAITSGQNWVGAQGQTPNGGGGDGGASPSPTSGTVTITFLPSPTPVAPPQATFVPVATSAPLPPGTPWTTGDCNSYALVLQKDYDLDLAAVTTHPENAVFYTTMSQEWTASLQDMAAGPCHGYPSAFQPRPLSGSDCTGPVGWFTAARRTHLIDQARGNVQAPADWNSYWISWYDRLIASWASQPGCAS